MSCINCRYFRSGKCNNTQFTLSDETLESIVFYPPLSDRIEETLLYIGVDVMEIERTTNFILTIIQERIGEYLDENPEITIADSKHFRCADYEADSV